MDVDTIGNVYDPHKTAYIDYVAGVSKKWNLHVKRIMPKLELAVEKSRQIGTIRDVEMNFSSIQATMDEYNKNFADLCDKFKEDYSTWLEEYSDEQSKSNKENVISNKSNANSANLFDNTPSAIAETPMKSPILSNMKIKRSSKKFKQLDFVNVEDEPIQESREGAKDEEDDQNKECVAEEEKKSEGNEASKATKDGSEPETRDKILEFDDFEFRKKLLQDTESGNEVDDLESNNKKIKSSTPLKETRVKTKRLTKKMKKLQKQITPDDPNLDSSSSEDLQPSSPRATKKQHLSSDNSDSDNCKADYKLHVECLVDMKEFGQKILDEKSTALAMSETQVADKEFNKIINLDGLKGKKKSKNDLVNGKKQSKKQKKSDKNQSDKENDVDSDASNNDDKENNKSTGIPVEQDLSDEAENEAKEALLKCSSSENEVEESMDVDETGETPMKMDSSEKTAELQTTKSKIKIVKAKDEQLVSKDQEVDQEKKEKNDWKRDNLLTFSLIDTDSEEEKAKNSLEKSLKKDKDANNKSEIDVEMVEDKEKVSKKGRKQPKRMIFLDSDSDIDFEVGKENEDKKKKGEKRHRQSSDSDISFTSSYKKKSKSKRKRIKTVASSDDSESDEMSTVKDSPGKGRRNIREVLEDKQVAGDTKKAARAEKKRLKRIADRQKLFNDLYESRLADEAKVENLVLDVDEETKEELVVVDPELVKRLKPHQAQGIKFMWDACFESLKQIQKSDGSGCIIAHCMGLGKTFQVVSLVHTLLSNEETKVKTVMVVCPLNTVLNWVSEFNMWLKHTNNVDDIDIYEMTRVKKNAVRKSALEKWQKTGGVLVIGYQMFRNLTSPSKKMKKAIQEFLPSFTRSLVNPGADLVVCDEGHLLKNEDTALSKAMQKVKTKRRIVLTGTPLQNNLKEYHCMVQFVKPNLLGTKKEFANRFVNPITNGQFHDSTPLDVFLMKKRAHVLHKMLEASVQRFDYSVLTPFLPPKQEYVIFVRLTEVQIKMYQYYLDHLSRKFYGALFPDFQQMQRIWTHPYAMRLHAEEKQRLAEGCSDSEGSLRDFIDDGSEEEVKEKIQKEVPPVQAKNDDSSWKWWPPLVEEEHFDDLRISTKLVLLFQILYECEQIGDKVLIFSQSLFSLSLIEHFLKLIDEGEGGELLGHHTGTWKLGRDYFRLDGSCSTENRNDSCKIFNNPKNTRARLFLISTKAGSLGINLTAANRAVIFDASWNPSHDVQSIFRIYRFGQKKPCYIYRLLAAGTMEEKIYNRQVTKLSLACRVVDEQQIERHYSNHDLEELYRFDTYEDVQITLAMPKDQLLAEIFLKHREHVFNFHEHDSLLENKEEEELDEEERKQAWLEFEAERRGKQRGKQKNNTMNMVDETLLNMINSSELESMEPLPYNDSDFSSDVSDLMDGEDF